MPGADVTCVRMLVSLDLKRVSRIHTFKRGSHNTVFLEAEPTNRIFANDFRLWLISCVGWTMRMVPNLP